MFSIVAVSAVLISLPVSAKKTPTGSQHDEIISDGSSAPGVDNPASAVRNRGLNLSASATTLTIASYSFNTGSTCNAQGGTTVDLTAQTGDYWHVDDFAGLTGSSIGGITFSPIQGTKSIWVGKRPPSAGPIDTIHCGYLALPGYENSWTQSFCSKDCLPVAGGPTPDLDIAFKLKFDSEPSYDYTALEVTNAPFRPDD